MAKNQKFIREQKKYQNLQKRYEEMNDFLLELIENTEPADYEWESVYEDIPANVKYIVKDGKATIESEISEFDM